MEKNIPNKNKEDALSKLKGIKDITTTRKYPFLGFSPSLIDYFLLIGYDIPSKSEVAFNFLATQNQPHSETKESRTFKDDLDKEINFPSLIFHTDMRPVVLNCIGNDFTNAALDEEIIIKRFFPSDLVPIYYELNKRERTELPIQNAIFFLKANRIFNFDDAHYVKDEKLKNDVMFNVYGFIFYEHYIIEGKDQKQYRLFFPKVFVFISQYTCFKYFSFLSQNIHFRIKNPNLNFEIPLEVQLYNIVNFTPSPINSNLCLDLLINEDLFNLKKSYSANNDIVFKLKKNSDNNEHKNDNSIFINQMTGFPYLDINLVSMFMLYNDDNNNNNIDVYIILYIFAFLEIKCLFFSPYLDPINNIMYVLNILLYPFMNISDKGQIYTVSKEEILDKNKIIDNYMTGVNCNYSPGMELPEAYKESIIINFDREITIYYKGENIHKYDSSSDISKLYHFLKKFLKEEEPPEVYFLEKKLKVLNYNIGNNFVKFYTINDNTDEGKKEVFFNSINVSDIKKNEFKYKYNELEEININIQKYFYSFNINVMEYFHDIVKLVESDYPHNELKDKTIRAYYELGCQDKGEQNSEKNDNSIKFNDYDKIFLNYLRKTKKFSNFVGKYLTENNCQEILKPSLIMSEEFMNINKSITDEIKDNFVIISRFYKTSYKLRKINFNKFYIYYNENLAKIVYDYAQETKVWKINKNEKKDPNSKNINYSYQSKENVLDNNILQRYSYLLNNMDPKLFNSLFPHLKFKLNENFLDDINQNLFAEFLENHLLENKIFGLEEVFSFIILIIYIITLKKNKILFHFFEEIAKCKIISKKCYIRKYIYLILYILNEKVRDKIKQNKNYLKELLLYKEIMGCISQTKEKDGLFYYPNALLSDIVNNFNIYQNYYAKLLEKDPKYSEENKETLELYNNFTRELLEDGVDYKVFLQNNSCEDKGAIKDEVLVNITEALEYKGLIQTTCKTCKFKIKPNLFFIFVPLDKCNSVGFYSVIYSYKSSLKILNKILNNIDKGNIDDDYFTICANMIFYINFKTGLNNLLSRYIATTLKI